MNDTDETRPLLRDSEATQEKRSGLTLKQAVIIPCIILYFFGYGLYIYVLPEYVQNYFMERRNNSEIDGKPNYEYCSQNKSDPYYQIYTHAQQETALWMNYFTIAVNVPAIFTTLIWTSYSDIVGRKFLFVLCISGSLTKIVLTVFVVHYKASLITVVIAHAIEGLAGSSFTLYSVLFSFVADVTKYGTSRTLFIVLFEFLMDISFTISTFATGYFVTSSGFFFPMLTSVILTLIAVVIVASKLPETRSDRKRGSVKLLFTNASKAGYLYVKPGLGYRRIQYILLMASFILLAIPSLNRVNIEILYLLGRPFCWSSTKIGYFGTIRAGLVSLVGLVGVTVLQKYFADDTIAAISACQTIASFIVEGLATTDAVLYTVPVLAAMASVPISMIRSLMSHMTSSDEQGALFASIGAVETMCNLASGLTNNMVYAATLSIMSGFIFFVLAIITALGLVIILIFMCVKRRQTYKDQQTLDENTKQ